MTEELGLKPEDVAEMRDRLDSYVAELKTRGEKLPTWKCRQKPNFRAISATTGIDYHFLFTPAGRQRITLAVQEIGLTPPDVSGKLRFREQFKHNCTRLNRYLKWLEENGLRLPEDPKCKGEIFFPQLEIEANLNQGALILRGIETEKAYKVRLRQTIQQSIPQLGMEVRVLPQTPGKDTPPTTYEYLLQRGTKERKREFEGRRHAKAQLYNTRTALSSFLKALEIKPASVVGKEFVVDFKQSVETAMGRLEIAASSKKKFRTEIYWWHKFYRRLIKEQSIPDDFRGTFIYLVERSGLSFFVLSKLTGASRAALMNWYSGQATPSTFSFAAISRLESLFKLTAGTLTTKIPGGSLRQRFRLTQLPKFLSVKPSFARRISPFLPDDFCDFAPDRQKEIVESIRTTILRCDDPFNTRLRELQHLPYKLKQWPCRLLEEFSELAAFKMKERAPLGMMRKGTWRPATMKRMQRELSYLFGALCLPPTGEDERARGLGIPTEHLSLAMLACPLLIDWYIRFRYEKRNRYNSESIRFIGSLSSMLRRETGWIRQRPQLASRLHPVNHNDTELISEDLIVKAKADWNNICDEAVKYYHHLELEIEPHIEVRRDPFMNIEGIVKMADPIKAFELLIKSLRGDFPTLHTQPTLYHLAVRDCALILLIQSTGLGVIPSAN